jgi:hypothetical protein
MNQFMFSGLVVLMAYLIGSISFAVVVSKLMGLPDPHNYGSGNPGATNVLRTGSKAAAVLTLLGDTAKGYVAVALARALVGVDIDSWVLPAVTVAAFLGHVFPIFHGGEQGKVFFDAPVPEGTFFTGFGGRAFHGGNLFCTQVVYIGQALVDQLNRKCIQLVEIV